MVYELILSILHDSPIQHCSIKHIYYRHENLIIQMYAGSLNEYLFDSDRTFSFERL